MTKSYICINIQLHFLQKRPIQFLPLIHTILRCNLKMNNFMFNVKQLAMNKFIKYVWQLIINMSNATLEAPSLRPCHIFNYFAFHSMFSQKQDTNLIAVFHVKPPVQVFTFLPPINFQIIHCRFSQSDFYLFSHRLNEKIRLFESTQTLATCCLIEIDIISLRKVLYLVYLCRGL